MTSRSFVLLSLPQSQSCKQIVQVSFSLFKAYVTFQNILISGQDFLSMAFADSGESEDEDTGKVDITKHSRAKEQFKLSKALAVMGVKASTFHSLHVGGKKDRV